MFQRVAGRRHASSAIFEDEPVSSTFRRPESGLANVNRFFLGMRVLYVCVRLSYRHGPFFAWVLPDPNQDPVLLLVLISRRRLQC